MEIIKLTEDKYEEWDKFCMESDDAWFWHTSGWIGYNKNLRVTLKDVSFFVEDNKAIKAICPLLVSLSGKTAEFSFGLYPGPTPAFKNFLSDKEYNKISKLLFEQIEQIAKNEKIKKGKFRFPVLNKSYLRGRQQFNFLTKFGYLDISLATQVLDLTLPLKEIKSNLRHGHKYDINQAEKNIEIIIFDNQCRDLEKYYGEYLIMHRSKKADIRPQKTYDLMFDFIKNGSAFLVVAKHHDKNIAFSYLRWFVKFC